MEDEAEESVSYDGTVMRAGSGGSLAVTITKPLVAAMKLKQGDKVEIWFVRETEALYLVVRKRKPSETPSILKKLGAKA